MATWTELFGAAQADDGHDADRVVRPDELRELLLDLPHHPGLCHVRAVTLHLEGGRELTLDLPAGESMASGASGLLLPNAGVQRGTVQPWRVTPVLGDAGVEGALTRPNPEPFHLASAGWLDGIKFYPPGETTRRLADDKPLIIPGDA